MIPVSQACELTNSVFIGTVHWIILSSGWRRWFVAMLCGAIGALAMAPANILPAFVVSMVGAVWLLDGAAGDSAGKSRSRFSGLITAAIIGWWFGFGYFIAGLWWLGAAFLVEADKFAWALPLGVVGLPAVLAVFPAFGFLLARMLWSGGAARVLALAAGLGIAEWLRAILFTGFPWNDMGMVLGGNLVLGQFAAITGLHGLTFLAIAIAAAPATLAYGAESETGRGFLGGSRYRPVALAALSLACLAAFGFLRLGGNPTEYTGNVRMRLMQPNIAQDQKFRPEAGPEILAAYLKLSDRSTSPQTTGVATVTHLFWPESPFPFILSRNAEALAQIGKALPRTTTLITGAARAELSTARRSGSGRRRTSYFNSIQLVESGGLITLTYDKMHLVPFGEYLPLSAFLNRFGITQFIHVPGGFEPGIARKTLSLRGIGEVAPLVCYEAIFPGIVSARSRNGNRPALIVNLTNDGWFGPTFGPYQHLAQARLRTIEEGLPMVRVANTGVSAVVDAHGRILQKLPLGVEGVIDSRLPKPASATVFSRHGTPVPGSLALLFLVIALYFRLRRQF